MSSFGIVTLLQMSHPMMIPSMVGTLSSGKLEGIALFVEVLKGLDTAYKAGVKHISKEKYMIIKELVREAEKKRLPAE